MRSVLGWHPGVAITFLVTVPVINITSYGVLANMHGRRAALTFTGCMVTLATLLG